MGQIFIAAFVVAFSIISLYDPKLYRKLLAPLCSVREDELPPFPRSAALALFVFFGLVIIAPEALRVAGFHIRIPQRSLDWLVAIAFLVVGLGLMISPKMCIRILRWPEPQRSISIVVARIVGMFLLLASVLLTRLEVLHR